MNANMIIPVSMVIASISVLVLSVLVILDTIWLMESVWIWMSVPVKNPILVDWENALMSLGATNASVQRDIYLNKVFAKTSMSVNKVRESQKEW